MGVNSVTGSLNRDYGASGWRSCQCGRPTPGQMRREQPAARRRLRSAAYNTYSRAGNFAALHFLCGSRHTVNNVTVTGGSVVAAAWLSVYVEFGVGYYQLPA
jgi:hypothetical protein